MQALAHPPQCAGCEERFTQAPHHDNPAGQAAETEAEAEKPPEEAKNVTPPGAGRERVTEAVHDDPDKTHTNAVPLIVIIADASTFTKEAVNVNGAPGATAAGADKSSAGAAEQAPATHAGA